MKIQMKMYIHDVNAEKTESNRSQVKCQLTDKLTAHEE